MYRRTRQPIVPDTKYSLSGTWAAYAHRGMLERLIRAIWAGVRP